MQPLVPAPRLDAGRRTAFLDSAPRRPTRARAPNPREELLWDENRPNTELISAESSYSVLQPCQLQYFFQTCCGTQSRIAFPATIRLTFEPHDSCLVQIDRLDEIYQTAITIISE